MAQERVERTVFYIGEIKVTMSEFRYGSEHGDTEVLFQNEYALTISGTEKNNFKNELIKLIDKYRI